MTNKTDTLMTGILGLMMLTVAGAATAEPSRTHFDKKNIQFEKTNVEGVSGITLWGEGDNAVLLLKLDAGTIMPWHAHTNRYWGMSIQGNWIHTDENRKENVVSQGSYTTQKGKVFHGDRCEGTEDCLILLDFEGVRDLYLPE